jgi:ABC-type multidrug transport system fused ATPase/permease subunit
MNLRQTVRASLDLLTSRDRKILIVVTLAQMSTALLDLLGVLLIGVVTALSVTVMSGGPPPAPVEMLVNRLGMGGMGVLKVALALAMAAGALLVSKSIINVVLTRRVLTFLATRQAMVSGRLAARLLSRPLLELQQRSSQESAYALTGGANFATLIIISQGVALITEVTLLLVLAAGLLIVSPEVTAFTAAFFLVLAVILQRVLSHWAGRLGRQSSKVEIASYAAVQEALRTYREVVVSNRRGLYVERFQELRWHASQVQADLMFMSQIPKYVFEVALIVGAGLLAASQLMSKDTTAAIGVIAVFLAAGSRIVPSMLRLQNAAIALRSASGQAAPTFALALQLQGLDTPVEESEGVVSMNAEQLQEAIIRGYEDFVPTILLRDVGITFPNAAGPALTEISFELKAGESLALVGPTGAGKSTLADVILGVLRPDRGSVEIGGVSPPEAISRWSGGIGYVPQDVAMANGTVRENVALGLPQGAINDEWVWKALHRARLADYLLESRNGLDTIIGEGGVKLSGGQRQRLGIARALYTSPKLLVLDEATSALDAETEQALSETLQSLEGSVTTVTIAHRLATIRHCDLVIYFEQGRIVASGPFDQVRELSPNFDEQAALLGL